MIWISVQIYIDRAKEYKLLKMSQVSQAKSPKSMSLATPGPPFIVERHDGRIIIKRVKLPNLLLWVWVRLDAEQIRRDFPILNSFSKPSYYSPKDALFFPLLQTIKRETLVWSKNWENAALHKVRVFESEHAYANAKLKPMPWFITIRGLLKQQQS